MATIYALRDPRTPEVFSYVGQTRMSIAKRLKHHKAAAYRQRVPRKMREWVTRLNLEGYAPEAVLLAVTPDAGSDEVEREWIARLVQAGHPLLNTQGLPRTPVLSPSDE